MWGIAPPFRACGPSTIYLHARAFSGTGSVRSRCYPEPTLRLVLLIHLVWASSTQLGNGWSSLLLRRGRHRFGVEAVSYRRRAATAGAGGALPSQGDPPLLRQGSLLFYLVLLYWPVSTTVRAPVTGRRSLGRPDLLVLCSPDPVLYRVRRFYSSSLVCRLRCSLGSGSRRRWYRWQQRSSGLGLAAGEPNM